MCELSLARRSRERAASSTMSSWRSTNHRSLNRTGRSIHTGRSLDRHRQRDLAQSHVGGDGPGDDGADGALDRQPTGPGAADEHGGQAETSVEGLLRSRPPHHGGASPIARLAGEPGQRPGHHGRELRLRQLSHGTEPDDDGARRRGDLLEAGEVAELPQRLRVVAGHLSPAQTVVEAVVEPLLGAAEGRAGHVADQDGIDGVFEAGVQQTHRQPRVLVIVRGAAAVARRLTSASRPHPLLPAGPAAALLQPLVRGSSPSSSTRLVPLSLSGGSMA